MKKLGLLTILLPFLLTACASTTVKQNPGKHDKGIRYYRPKPYLLITQAKDQPEKYVDIKLEYHPDFSEEYAIHVRTGIGKNKTSVKLDNGWNLTSIDIDIDSEIPENIKAVSDLVGSVGGLIKKTAGEAEPAEKFRVAANNVPFGYYESVISEGPDGKKHLYGWRYVGFGPFSQCPIMTTGLECANCQTTPMYALVMRNGVMTFVPLSMAAEPSVIQSVSVASTPPVPETASPFSSREAKLKEKSEELRAKLSGLLKAKLGATAGEPKIDAAYDETMSKLVITIGLPAGALPGRLTLAEIGGLNKELKAATSSIIDVPQADILLNYPPAP